MRADLPEPTADERAHGERVAARLRAEIAAAGGALDFSRWMELALYAPGLGYYSAGTAKFGRDGDFVTAPELGFVFARCLARALAPVLRATEGDVLELGPGSGALAADLLLELERLDALPRAYRLLERSADLRARQQATLARRCPHLAARAQWLDAPPTDAWAGAIVANEVADALPVRLFALREAGLFARAVALAADGAYAIRDVPADAALAAAVTATLGARIDALPRPYASEICPLLAPWFAAVTQSLARGTVFVIDYGHDRADYYAPQRRAGTLRCHYRQRAHDDPLILPGLQDITAWVDIDALVAAGRACGFEPVATQSQASFLIAHGLDEVFAAAWDAADDEAARYRLAQQVKQLTLPGAMGDAFRVVALRRG
jgi:SAM-dependent MidA family methyltransferase